MDITPYKNRRLFSDEPVDVYRCLNRKGHVYSLRQGGYVVGHVENITLKDVKFIVNQSGKQRAIQTKSRNVHAFIRGMVEMEPKTTNGINVFYNPFNEYGFHMFSPDNEVIQLHEWEKEININKFGVFLCHYQ